MRTFEAWVLGYLLNSLWQIPLVFAAARLAVRAVRRGGPAMEHRVWVSALMLEVLLPACPASPNQLLRNVLQFLPWNFGHRTMSGDAHITVVSGAGYMHSLLQLPAHLLAVVVLAYLCSVAGFTVYLLWGLWRISATHRRAQYIVLAGAAASTWIRCCSIFAVHDAEVATSHEISCPMTIGIRHRLLLLPAKLPAAMQEEDLDAVIAHEFAHMRRRDFAKNLVYALLSLPGAYHPLLRLTRARVDQSREMICDAMAAKAVAGSHRYARSLLRLASLFVHGSPSRTLHTIGIFDANIFERRVMNLTRKPMELRGARRLAMAAVCVLIGLGTCASALALRVNVAARSLQSGAKQSTVGEAVPRVSARVMASNSLTKVNPVYPSEAKAAKISGPVILRAIIGKDGTMKNLAVVSGPKELRESALDAVKQWTYKPYLLNGNPIEVETTITVNYSLR